MEFQWSIEWTFVNDIFGVLTPFIGLFSDGSGVSGVFSDIVCLLFSLILNYETAIDYQMITNNFDV